MFVCLFICLFIYYFILLKHKWNFTINPPGYIQPEVHFVKVFFFFQMIQRVSFDFVKENIASATISALRT